MTRYHLIRLVLALTFLCPLTKARGELVSFVKDPVVRNLVAGQPYSEPLVPLLNPMTGSPQLKFTMFADQSVSGSTVPPWLKINSNGTTAPIWTTNGAAATAAPVGSVYTFSMQATIVGSDSGTTAQVQITVNSVPNWGNVTSINLGSVQENGTLTVNVLTSTGVVDPLGQPLTFAFDPTPGTAPPFNFTSMTSAGVVTAIPTWNATHTNVGVFSGFKIKATTASGGSSEIPATITVTKLFEGPSWTAISLPNATDNGVPYSQSLSSFVTEPETNAVLTYSIVSGAPSDNWLSLTSSGVLQGTAGCAHDDGPVTLTVQVSTTDPTNPSMPAITAQTGAQFTVTHVTGTPSWATNPIIFQDAKIGGPVLDQLIATDPSCEALTYKLVSGPTWTTGPAVSSTGLFTGTAGFANLGVNTWQVQASNSKNSATTTVQITVDKTPSTWLKNPIVLSDAKEAVSYPSGSLTSYIVNPDGGPITCTLLTTPAPPAWVSVTPGCQVTGTPKVTDIGQGSFQVQMSDGTNQAVTTVQITVDPNHPPVCSQTPITLTPDAAERSNYQSSVSSFVTDPYPPFASTLKTALVSGPAWVKVGANGSVSGTPARADVGPNSFVVSVTNTINQSVNCTVNVTVDKVPQPPVWTPNTYAFTAQAGVAFTGNISAGLSDPNSETLNCAKSATAPGWVTVDPLKCTLSGTPAAVDVTQSPETFTVTATNTDSLTVTATVTITVVYVPPSWTLNPIPLPNATATLPFTGSVLQYVSNPSKAPITCSKVAGTGPGWLIVNPDCSLSGTPATTDITSKYTVTLQVSDGKDTPAQTQAFGAVLQNWVPPVINQTALNFTVKENTTVNVDLTQPQYITNSNPGDALSCALTSTKPSWLTLSSTCQLTMSPLHANIGAYALNFTVSNTHALSATGVLNVTVVINPQPPVCQQPIAFSGKAGVPFSATIGNLCTDSDNLSLSYAATSGFPSWLTLDIAGNLSGTPQESNVGVYNLVVTVTNGYVPVTINVTVTIVTSIVPPICTAIKLPDATVATAYMQSIASFCSDPLGGTLTYTKVSGPAWAFVTSSGGIIGTPAQTDLGTGNYQVTVANAKGSLTVNFTIKVDPVPPLSWKPDPIPLGNQPVGQPFTFNLVPFIVNPAAGTTVTCTKVSGPNWLYLSSSCQLSGTPGVTDIGPYTAVFSANNGGGAVSVGAFGAVVNGPTISVSCLTYTMNEYDTLNVNLNTPQCVTGSSPFTFSLAAPSWVTVTSAGSMTAKPLDPQVGTNVYPLTVTDTNKIATTAQLTIIVLKHLKPPVWSQNPILFTTPVNVPFNQSIASYVTDPQGLPLTFTLTWMPDNNWLTVSPQGTLTGTPKPANIGDNNFWITATNNPSDPTAGSQVTVIITVTNAQPVDDTVIVDSPVPGASVENLWVLDSACSCGHKNAFIEAFSASMHAYFDVLDAAHIQHTGIYLSSNPTASSTLTGNPIKGADGSTLLTWNESNVVADFQERIEATQACKCNSSPIWSMFLFYNQVLKGLPEYQHSYFMPHVPAEALIVSSHDDYFGKYAASTAQASWSAAQYATNFMQVNSTGQKTFVINAMAPKCLNDREDTPDLGQLQDMDENHWLTMTETTDPKGTYWREPGCHPDMTADLTAYANNVKFLAYVQAHSAIQLSKTPSDPTQIQVFVSGKQLTASQWSYDASKNQVDIFWNLIDMSTVNSGDKIEIKYQGS